MKILAKLLVFSILNSTLSAFLIFIPQPALANQEQIKSLLQQRLELLEETLRLARLRYQAGVGILGDIERIMPEILEVRLQMIDTFEVKDTKKALIQAFEATLEEALQTERDTKLLEQAGLVTRFDALRAESWRLEIQIQLEREKESLEQR